MLFQYQIRKEGGLIYEGEIEASNEKEAFDLLSKEKGDLIFLKKKKELNFNLQNLSFFNRVKKKDLVIFSRQLSTMISASLALVKALETLIKQTTNPTLKKIIVSITEDVKGGAKLSSALSRYPKVFDVLFVNMVKTGETVGKLDEVLNYLADEQEKDYEIRGKIKSALMYPVVIILVVIVVIVVMMTFVVPKLTAVLIESGVELPITTRILIGSSNFLVHYWWLVFLAILGLIVIFKAIIRTKKGRSFFDRLKLRVPIFGKLIQRIYLVQMTRSLSTLIAGGVPLTTSLRVVAEVVDNVTYKNLIKKTIREVESGKLMANTFLQSQEMPVMLGQMISVGEQTGQLDIVLEKISNFYSREIEGLIVQLVSLIEPLIIVFLGLGVAFVVASIILPMYNLAGGG